MTYAHYDDIQHGHPTHRAYAITQAGLREYYNPGTVVAHSPFDLSHVRLRQPDALYQIMLAARRENLNPVAIGVLLGNKNTHQALVTAQTLYPLKRYLERRGFDAIKMTDPKDAGKKVMVVFNSSQVRPGQHRGTQRYAQRHAPKGGVTIGSKEFKGGEFIPAGVFAQATPEQQAAIEAGEPVLPPAEAPPFAPPAPPPSPDLPLVQFHDQPTIDFNERPTKLKPLPGKSAVSAGQVVESLKKMQPLSRVEFDHTSPNFRPKEYAKRIDIAVDEIAYMLGMNVRGKAGTRSDQWYTRGIVAALDASKEFAPELHDKLHPGYRLAFFALCAICSINTAPSTNWNNTLQRFTLMCDSPHGAPQFPVISPYPDKWKNEGNKKPGVMEKSIELLNSMLRTEYAKHADIKDEKERRNRTFLELNRWLSTNHERGEMYEIRQEAKMESGDYVFRPNDTKRTPGSFAPTGSGLGGAKGVSMGFQIFGSKVPRFFLNIVGEHMHATVDKWATRSIARIFGQLDDERRWGDSEAVDAPLDNEYASMESVLKDIQDRLRERTGLNLDTDQVQAAWWFFEKRLWENHGYKAARESTAFFENGAVDIPRQWIEMRRSGAGRAFGKSGSGRGYSPAPSGKAKYDRVNQLLAQRSLVERITRYAAKHAPVGGVTIQGRTFSGGEFIPGGEYAKATPAEKAKIDGKHAKDTATLDALDNVLGRPAPTVDQVATAHHADMMNQVKIAAKIKGAVDTFLVRNPDMQEKAESFKKLMAKIAGKFSPKATALIAKNLQEVKLMPSVESVTTDLEGREHRRHKPGDSTAGFFDPRAGVLVIDGDADWGRQVDPDLKEHDAIALHEQGLAFNTYAHELWHAVDCDRENQTDMVYSGTEDWINAGNKEIVKWDYEKDSHGNMQPVRPLTHYAASSPAEGFAEYGRLVINNPQLAQTKFPLCWAFFKKNGLVA